MNRIYDLLALDLQEEMTIPSFDPQYDIPYEVTAQVVTGGIIRSVIWWLENDNTYSIDDMAEMLYKVFYHPVNT